MAQLPSGTVTFLFTDIEGSTARWEHQPEAMRAALARHDALVRAAIHDHDGQVVKTMGDAFHAVFVRAPDAVAAALDAQRRLQDEPWSQIGPIRVRMAVHTGAAEERDGDYYGPPLNRAARLMSAGHGGQMLLSEVAAGLVRDTLPDGVDLLDLGRHRLKDLSEPEHIFQVVASDLPSDFPALASLDARPNNLPTHPTALLGRERELAEVRKLFGDGARLVTLTGPGGTGKTRLSLQVAAEMLDDFADGTFLVELAPISAPGLVPSTIAQVLGLRDIGGRPVLENLKGNLRSRSTLLVLDNFEQLLPAAPVIADLLASGPSLKMLVTSREPLRLRGEHEYAVPPLTLPDARDPATPGSLVQYAAVALFLERAVAIRSNFTLTHESAPAVAEICARLDGLPLAIELAAARVRLLTPQAIAGRLERRLPLLTGGARDLPTRQQTLRDTIAWSQDLLDDPERRLFRRLSVFVGGWTLEAATAVCDPDDLAIDLLDGLESLASKSLIRRGEDSDSQPRFGMLETIREYGMEQLELSGEAAHVRRRHAGCFVAFAERAMPQIHTHQQVAWLRRLDLDHDNLRAALAWSRSGDGGETGLRIAGALVWFWEYRGHVGEARGWLAEMLSFPGTSLPARARALLAASGMAYQQGDFSAMRLLAREGTAIFLALGDPSDTGRAYIYQGLVELMGDNIVAARSFAEQSVSLCRAAGDRWGLAFALSQLAWTYREETDLPLAQQLRDEAIAISRQLGDRWTLGVTLVGAARVTSRQGDHDRASELYREGLVALSELDDLSIMPRAFGGLATTSQIRGDGLRAARLFGAMEALRETGGTREVGGWRLGFEQSMTDVRASLGDDAFAAAWAEGRTMSVEQAVAYALERAAQA